MAAGLVSPGSGLDVVAVGVLHLLLPTVGKTAALIPYHSAGSSVLLEAPSGIRGTRMVLGRQLVLDEDACPLPIPLTASHSWLCVLQHMR